MVPADVLAAFVIHGRREMSRHGLPASPRPLVTLPRQISVVHLHRYQNGNFKAAWEQATLVAHPDRPSPASNGDVIKHNAGRPCLRGNLGP